MTVIAKGVDGSEEYGAVWKFKGVAVSMSSDVLVRPVNVKRLAILYLNLNYILFYNLLRIIESIMSYKL